MKKVKNLMPSAEKRLITVPNNTKLIDLADVLTQNKNHMVVVCDDDGCMLGIVTRRDIVEKIRGCQGSSCSTSCIDVMQKDVISCIPGDSLLDIWKIMKNTQVRNIPVINEDKKPIGLISTQCVLEELLLETEEEEELLKEYIMCVGYR